MLRIPVSTWQEAIAFAVRKSSCDLPSVALCESSMLAELARACLFFLRVPGSREGTS